MKIAAIQLSANNDKTHNIQRASVLVRRAFQQRSRMVFLPEVFNFRADTTQLNQVKQAAEYIGAQSLKPLMAIAREFQGFIHAGSILELKGNSIYNTSAVINPQGKIIKKYRKIHLFKARLGDKIINEANCMSAGKRLATVAVDGFKMGLSICYDLRFSQMFSQYQRLGVDVLAVPASFTRTTGKAHWEVLLRARAIENLAYVVAANQAGVTPGGVNTYGHSMIINPWGEIIAQAKEELETIIYADINRREIEEARQRLPGIIR